MFYNVRGAVYYEPAGGKIEIDFTKKIAETLEECAIREIKEELGLSITLDEYVGSYYFFWIIAPHRCSSCAVFTGKILDEDPTFTTNTDSCELTIEPIWVTLDEILEKKITIDPSYVGLENLLIKYCNKAKKQYFNI